MTGRGGAPTTAAGAGVALRGTHIFITIWLGYRTGPRRSNLSAPATPRFPRHPDCYDALPQVNRAPIV